MKTTTHEFPISEDQQRRIAAGETVAVVDTTLDLRTEPVTEQREAADNPDGHSYPDMTEKFKIIEQRAEHQRLRDAVVETALADRRAEWKGQPDNADIDKLIAARRDFRLAVTALIEFERG